MLPEAVAEAASQVDQRAAVINEDLLQLFLKGRWLDWLKHPRKRIKVENREQLKAPLDIAGLYLTLNLSRHVMLQRPSWPHAYPLPGGGWEFLTVYLGIAEVTRGSGENWQMWGNHWQYIEEKGVLQVGPEITWEGHESLLRDRKWDFIYDARKIGPNTPYLPFDQWTGRRSLVVFGKERDLCMRGGFQATFNHYHYGTFVAKQITHAPEGELLALATAKYAQEIRTFFSRPPPVA